MADLKDIIEQEAFEPKWYLNGFPKSGLHMIAQMVVPFARPLFGEEGTPFARPWSGAFNDWTTNWRRSEPVCYKIGQLRSGTFIKGHNRYAPEIERFLWYLGVAHVFIYRDLRDVAVSQTYHIMSADDEHLFHGGKKELCALGGFDEILSAVIAGHGKYPGVIERWVHYAPWLNCDWTLCLRFEDVRPNLREWAQLILDYALTRSVAIWGYKVDYDAPEVLDAILTEMVKAANRHEKSPTFRKGEIGNWRDEFKSHHIDLWREYDPDDWINKLGYEPF